MSAKNNDLEEYEVEKVVDHRYRKTAFPDGSHDEYLIKWKGYPSSENTWEPESNLNPSALAEARTLKWTTEQFENTKSDELRKDALCISACNDWATAADVPNVKKSFKLPDAAGKFGGHGGGACCSSLLSILYADEKVLEEDLSFKEIIWKMRKTLIKDPYRQIPQMSSMNPIDVNTKFDLFPDTATGTKRAVMIGVNYVGDEDNELSGSHNDVLNMKRYIQEVRGFEEENIVILMDDGKHTNPTKKNIIHACKKVIRQAEENDAILFLYSGHGTRVEDDNGDERDGFDEAIVPRDFEENGFILDDDLYEILIKDLPKGVSMFSLFDCCHSATIMDLPYLFKGDEMQTEMTLDPKFNLDAFIEKITGNLKEFVQAKMAAKQKKKAAGSKRKVKPEPSKEKKKKLEQEHE
mmetsp:Transcript_2674/g.5757  ORF Transcript_2674/g.5757 Transcript_2674/m.5757 type:complete len:409 (-) Transcript_2674:175-1401(-)